MQYSQRTFKSDVNGSGFIIVKLMICVQAFITCGFTNWKLLATRISSCMRPVTAIKRQWKRCWQLDATFDKEGCRRDAFYSSQCGEKKIQTSYIIACQSATGSPAQLQRMGMNLTAIFTVILRKELDMGLTISCFYMCKRKCR